MSVIKVNNITNRDGTSGPEIGGIPVIDSNSHFVVPTGKTGQRYADGGENIVRDGLVLYLDAKYSYPGASGTDPDVYTWYDMSGNENHGELKNGVGFDSGNEGSLSFDGVDDYVNCGNNLNLNGSSTQITVSVWVKFLRNNGSREMIMEKHTSPSAGWWIARGPSRKIIWIIGGSGPYIDDTSTTTLLENTIYNVVGVFSGDNNILKVYVNGIDDGGTVAASGTTIPTSNNPLIIGKQHNWGNSSSNLSTYSAQIYNRALTAAEVSQNFEATKSRFGL